MCPPRRQSNSPEGAWTSGLLTPETVKEVLHSAKEAGGFGMCFIRRFSFEFGQKFALATGKTLWGFDRCLNVKVAEIARSQHRHSLASQAELLAGLRPLGNPHFSLR